jgi:hypothetical protein
MDIKETKQNIIQAGHKAVLELIKVAEEAILDNGDDDLSADKLKKCCSNKEVGYI